MHGGALPKCALLVHVVHVNFKLIYSCTFKFMIAIRNHELNNDFKEFLLITLELKKSFKSWCTNISLRNPSLFA